MKPAIITGLCAAGAAVITVATVLAITTPWDHPQAATAPPVTSTTMATSANSASQLTVPGTWTSQSSAPSSTAISSTRPGPLPALTAAQQRDPQAVATRVVTQLWSFDTALGDTDGTGPARRAAYLLTAAAADRETRPPTTGAGVAWQRWIDQHAWATVTAGPLQIPWTVADSRTSVVRNVTFVRTIHAPGLGDIVEVRQAMAVTLVRSTDAGPWRVDHLEQP